MSHISSVCTVSLYDFTSEIFTSGQKSHQYFIEFGRKIARLFTSMTEIHWLLTNPFSDLVFKSNLIRPKPADDRQTSLTHKQHPAFHDRNRPDLLYDFITV